MFLAGAAWTSREGLTELLGPAALAVSLKEFAKALLFLRRKLPST